MRVKLVEVDTKVMNRAVLDIQSFDSEQNFKSFEATYVHEFDPRYVTCKIQMSKMEDALKLQEFGFRFIECQIQSRFLFSEPCIVDDENFTYTQVLTKEDLESVISIARVAITEDRFSKDFELESSLSASRYELYLRDSFENSTDEIWLLKSKKSGEPIFFRSHRKLENKEVLLLLGGTATKYLNLGIGIVAWNFTVNQMLKSEVKGATTNISASNIAVFNLEINHIGFKVRNTFAVLRKLYK
jgi:hypothetical protein